MADADRIQKILRFLGSSSAGLEDMCWTSPGVGVKDAGGPFGLGALILDISTAEGDAIDIVDGAC